MGPNYVVNGLSVRCLVKPNGAVKKQMFTSGVHQRGSAGGFPWSSVLVEGDQDLISRAFLYLESTNRRPKEEQAVRWVGIQKKWYPVRQKEKMFRKRKCAGFAVNRIKTQGLPLDLV